MGFGLGKIGKVSKIAKSFRSSEKGDRSWDFKCEYITDLDGAKTEVKGKLKMIRKWKDSVILFESKEQQLKILLNDFEYFETSQERKRMGMNYKDKFAGMRFTDSNGKQQEYVFNIPNRKLDDFFSDLDKFLIEFNHEGKTLTIHTESGSHDVFLNLYNPDMHNDPEEQKMWSTVKITGEKSIRIVFTNYRMFFYDEKKEEVINPITYPVQCHVENERTEQITESESTNYAPPRDGGFIETMLTPKNKTKSKAISVQLGDVVIFKDGKSYATVSLQSPKDLENRINNFSKLFS